MIECVERRGRVDKVVEKGVLIGWVNMVAC